MNNDEQRIDAQIADVTGEGASTPVAGGWQTMQNSVEDVLSSQPSPIRSQPGGLPAARPLPDKSSANPLNNQFRGVMDQVRETVNTLRRGVGIPRQAAQSPSGGGQQNPVLSAFRSASPAAWGGAAGAIRGGIATDPQKVSQMGGAPQPAVAQVNPGGAAMQNQMLQVGEVGGRVARASGVSVARPAGIYGAQASPHYSYNGARVSIPDGFDLNDDNALRGYIDETNGLIDMMNRSYEEEV